MHHLARTLSVNHNIKSLARRISYQYDSPQPLEKMNRDTKRDERRRAEEMSIQLDNMFLNSGHHSNLSSSANSPASTPPLSPSIPTMKRTPSVSPRLHLLRSTASHSPPQSYAYTSPLIYEHRPTSIPAVSSASTLFTITPERFDLSELPPLPSSPTFSNSSRPTSPTLSDSSSARPYVWI